MVCRQKCEIVAFYLSMTAQRILEIVFNIGESTTIFPLEHFLNAKLGFATTDVPLLRRRVLYVVGMPLFIVLHGAEVALFLVGVVDRSYSPMST